MRLLKKLKEKNIPGFLKKSFFFLAIVFFLDLTLGHLLKYLYFKQDSGLLYRTTYSIDSTYAQLLIFGSSTANHHYVPGLFEKKMNTTLYNAGRDGNSILYHYSILTSVLKRYSPKIAILDFNMGEFEKDEQSYERLSSLLPYYESHPEIRSIIQQKNKYEKYKFLSQIYPFNSLIFTIAIGTSDLNKKRENTESKDGYIPLKRKWNKEITIDTTDHKYQLDQNKIKIFERFITDCKMSGVKLYIIVSPRFLKSIHEDPSFAIARKLANQFNISFFDFSNDKDFLQHPELFADISHLNDTGARIYSNKVIERIMENDPYDNSQNPPIKFSHVSK